VGELAAGPVDVAETIGQLDDRVDLGRCDTVGRAAGNTIVEAVAAVDPAEPEWSTVLAAAGGRRVSR
jgi:hypothetical protein